MQILVEWPPLPSPPRQRGPETFRFGATILHNGGAFFCALTVSTSRHMAVPLCVCVCVCVPVLLCVCGVCVCVCPHYAKLFERQEAACTRIY